MITAAQRAKRERDLCEHPMFDCQRPATTIVSTKRNALANWRVCTPHATTGQFSDTRVYDHRVLKPRVAR